MKCFSLATICVSIVLALSCSRAQGETYQLSTYYPAPSGRYKDLSAHSLNAPGLIYGGGTEQGVIADQETLDNLTNDQLNPVEECSFWGKAVCITDPHKIISLRCPPGSQKRLTGLHAEEIDIIHPEYRPPQYIRIYLCVSDGPSTE